MKRNVKGMRPVPSLKAVLVDAGAITAAEANGGLDAQALADRVGEFLANETAIGARDRLIEAQRQLIDTLQGKRTVISTPGGRAAAKDGDPPKPGTAEYYRQNPEAYAAYREEQAAKAGK